MTSCHPKGKAGWAQPDLRPDGDLTHGAGAVKLGGTRVLARGRNRISPWRLTRSGTRARVQIAGRMAGGPSKQESCQPCQSEAEARLSFGAVIAATTAISAIASEATGQGRRIKKPLTGHSHWRGALQQHHGCWPIAAGRSIRAAALQPPRSGRLPDPERGGISPLSAPQSFHADRHSRSPWK